MGAFNLLTKLKKLNWFALNEYRSERACITVNKPLHTLTSVERCCNDVTGLPWLQIPVIMSGYMGAVVLCMFVNRVSAG